MKTAGLPCRATQECDAVYSPKDPSTLASLLEAAAQRDAHELQVHGYRHNAITTLARPDFAAGPRVRRGRQRRGVDKPTVV